MYGIEEIISLLIWRLCGIIQVIEWQRSFLEWIFRRRWFLRRHIGHHRSWLPRSGSRTRQHHVFDDSRYVWAIRITERFPRIHVGATNKFFGYRCEMSVVKGS